MVNFFDGMGVFLQTKGIRSALDQQIPLFRLHFFWAQKYNGT
jgi:hypothetical protein